MEVRRAGLLERYYITRHQLGMYTGVVVAARYVRRDGQMLDKPTLLSALAKLIQRIAALGVRLAGEATREPEFVRLKRIDLSAVVKFHSEEGNSDSIPRALETQLLERFKTEEDKPLWRIAVLNDGTLLFAWHHTIGDGMSGLAFHRALFTALNEVEHLIIPDPPIISVRQDLAMVPPVETLTDLSPPWWLILREVARLFVPTSLTPLRSAWTGEPVPKTDVLTGVKIRLCQYSAVESKLMLDLCKQHHSTLTGILHTLATVVISEELAASQPESRNKFSCISSNIPISLRRLTKTPDDAMCTEVSIHHTYPPLVTRPPGQSLWLNDNLWQIAADLSVALQKGFDYNARQTGLLKFLFGNYEGFFKGYLGTKRHDTIQISNLGRFSLPDAGLGTPLPSAQKWDVVDTFFAQSQPTSAAVFSVNIVGTPSGGLTVAVVWNSNAVDDLFGERFHQHFKEAIDELVPTVGSSA